MKKYIPILVVIVLVLSIIGIARGNTVLASPQAAAGANAPLNTKINVTANGTSNVGGVCQITVNIGSTGKVDNIEADAEVPVNQSKSVILGVPVDQHLLFPGCHFVFSKGGVTLPDPVSPTDASVKVCFGASPELDMAIYYYLDTAYQSSSPKGSGVSWNLLPTTLEDSNRLICAPAQYNGVYMPAGMIPPDKTIEAGTNPFFPNGLGGTVLAPDPNITITASGTYAVGGICDITARYDVSGLSDTVQVEYPWDLTTQSRNHYTEDTLTVPFSAYVDGSLFYFPGCHVVHYKNQAIQDEMNKGTPLDGDWQICFAAIPDKTVTIYYYLDDTESPLETFPSPTSWKSLVTVTANGMACADLVNFSAVYAPAAH